MRTLQVLKTQIIRFVQDHRAAVDLGTIIGLAVALLVLSVLAPVAFEAWVAVDTELWDPTWITLWDMIPVFALLAVAIGFIMAVKDKI